jgi:cell division protein FtsX
VGAVVAVVLLVGFSVGIGVVLRARSVAVCRCFGASGGVLGRRHLVRNAVLVVVALAVVGGGASASVSLVAVVSGLVGALLVVGLDPVVEVFGRSV